MENEFYKLSRVVRSINLGFENADNHSELPNILQAFEAELLKLPAHQCQLFATVHYEELRRIRWYIAHLAKTSPQYRGFIDRIFTNSLRLNKRMPTSLTIIFNEFVQGVTYFINQSDNAMPVYHRLYSCGPHNDAFRNTFLQCTPTMSKNERQSIKNRIITCYVERLIYNAIYQHQSLLFPLNGTEYTARQDDGHEHWLMQTRNDFKSCFPKSDITVDILDFDNAWPLKLEVKRTIHGKVISTETYTRTLYIDVVTGIKRYNDEIECVRTTSNFIYFKVQQFALEMQWKRVRSL